MAVAPVRGPLVPSASNFSVITQTAYELAMRVLFIGATIWMATLFPPAWHWFVVPVVSVGATAIAALFFPRSLIPQGDLLYPRTAEVRNYPDNSPVGYRNVANNCAFNASAHFIDSDPTVTEWIRHPIHAMNAVEFDAFLRMYRVPDAWIEQFRAFVAERPQPALLFPGFLAQYQPQPGEERQVNEMRDLFTRLLQVHETLAQFYRANDAAVQAHQNISLGNTSRLRQALGAISATIDGNERVQEDATNVLEVVHGLLPPHVWPQIEARNHLRTAGLPDTAAGENTPQVQPMPAIKLHFQPRENRTTLEALIQRFCINQDEHNEPLRYEGVDGQRHTYPVDRIEHRFLTAPASIRFQLVRMGHERPPESWLNRWLPRIFPPLAWRGVKNYASVQVPDQVTIRLATGEEHLYQLRSFVTHHGGFGGGHYTAGEIRENHQFIENDSRVTLVENEEHRARWRTDLEQAYLLCYVRV